MIVVVDTETGVSTQFASKTELATWVQKNVPAPPAPPAPKPAPEPEKPKRAPLLSAANKAFILKHL